MIKIDFSKSLLTEHWTDFFASAVSLVLKAMFSQINAPIAISGTEPQVTKFAKAIGSEKRYIDAIRKYGLDDPKTHSNKYKLTKAISEFERETGLTWPIK